MFLFHWSSRCSCMLISNHAAEYNSSSLTQNSLSTDGTNKLYLEYKIRLLHLFFSALEEWLYIFCKYLSSIYNVWHHKVHEVGKLVMLSWIVARFKIGTHLFVLQFINPNYCICISLILPLLFLSFPLCGCFNIRPVLGFVFALWGNKFPLPTSHTQRISQFNHLP